jgi:hypothetical protein
MAYRKIMFSGPGGETAGLVVTSTWIKEHASNLTSDASRLFPTSEFRKMSRMFISPEFGTWDGAFSYNLAASAKRKRGRAARRPRTTKLRKRS